MKFQLITNDLNPLSTPIVEYILTNRNIPKEEMYHYLNTTDKDINSPLLFGGETLVNAARTLIKNIQEENKCLLIIDSDCDGYTSAAILINYLYDFAPSWVNNNLDWFIHSGKQHGIDEKELDLENLALDNYKLIICPDSGRLKTACIYLFH